MNQNILIALILLVVLVFVGWISLDKNSRAQTGADQQGDSAALPEEYANKRAIVHTNYGDFTIEFFDHDAPKAVENFIRLSLEGRYSNTPFHRVIEGFMVQTGDYTHGNGMGGQSIWGEPFEDELNPETESFKRGYKRGTVAMANAGPNTNGSQFFIMHADYPLPSLYTIFGQVAEGMEIIDAIAAVPVSFNPGGELSQPTEEIIIERITIEDR